MGKCQEGCTVCVDVCPCRAFFVPAPKTEKGKKKGKGKSSKTLHVAVNQDLCILCGACVYACPGEQALTIHRKGINVKGVETDMFKTIAEKLCTPRMSESESNPKMRFWTKSENRKGLQTLHDICAYSPSSGNPRFPSSLFTSTFCR
ncbi:4Fe-4S dicluster domain-containing protein [Methanocorpusculum sp.]